MGLRGVAVMLVVMAACKRDHPCEKLVDLTERCTEGRLPSRTLDEMELMCRSMRSQSRQPNAYDECLQATTCDELNACFARRACKFVLTGPDDRTPQFSCW